MATYQQSITALVDGLKTLFENRTCTEAQAIANATSKPNTIYYTSDTHCVVVGGQIYGRGQQLSSVFRFCPSGSVPGQDPDFSDPDYIYVVPDGTSFTLYWLNPGGAWSHTTGFQFDIATSAEDISYDLTPTPDLGTGDVQSAIEAVDGKVEQLSLDTMGKDESGEYWEDLLFERKGYSEISANNRRIGANHATTTDSSGVGRKIYIFPASEGDVFKVTGAAGSGDWTGFWKGGTAYSSITAANYLSSANTASGTYTAPANATLFAFVSIDARFTSDTAHVWKKTTRASKTPADIQRQLIDGWTPSVINTSALEVGDMMPYWAATTTYHGIRVEVKKGQVLLLDLQSTATYAPLVFTDYGRVITEMHQTPVYGAFEAPNDGYAYIQKLISHESDNYLYIMGYGGHAKDMADNRVGRDELQEQFDAMYQKGVEDGSAMASIVGLGYNVWDYFNGSMNMAGFEYGCEIRRKYDKTPVANMQNAYKNNTSVVYFPKTDFSGCTTLSGAFYGANKLLIFPSIDVGTKSLTCLHCFTNATSLQYVGDFEGLTITNAEYMFENCQALRRVGKLKFSASCSMANTFNVVAPNLTRIEELDVSAGTLLRYSSYNWNSGTKAKLRYIFIRGFGGNSGQGTLKVNVNWPLWGIADTENPDARQSLIDTLLTYSFDRATAGYSACTVTLSAATKALLTNEEKEQITAKGYTIA